MRKFIVKLAPTIIWALPSIALAQGVGIQAILTILKNILRFNVIPLLFVIATVIFLWGIIKFLTAAGNEEKLKEGKKLMMWGIIGLAVMLAAWGLVRAVVQTFLLPGGGIPCGPGDIGGIAC